MVLLRASTDSQATFAALVHMRQQISIAGNTCPIFPYTHVKKDCFSLAPSDYAEQVLFNATATGSGAVQGTRTIPFQSISTDAAGNDVGAKAVFGVLPACIDSTWVPKPSEAVCARHVHPATHATLLIWRAPYGPLTPATPFPAQSLPWMTWHR